MGGMMALAYLNFIAMVVGYITIVVVLLVILAFIGLVIREKYNDWKLRKKREQEKQSAPAAQTNQPAEQKKEEVQEPNVEISLK